MIFKYEVEIEVDDKNVSQKYLNYRFNYSNPKALADSIIYNLEHEGDTDMSKDGVEKWGYSIKVREIKEG